MVHMYLYMELFYTGYKASAGYTLAVSPSILSNLQWFFFIPLEISTETFVYNFNIML